MSNLFNEELIGILAVLEILHIHVKGLTTPKKKASIMVTSFETFIVDFKDGLTTDQPKMAYIPA